ncbi:MAG: amidohydrolase family protein, partial [Candidatus Hydrothermarchaeota archaeon]|nr:amidohydrolase family protein [Candidatus Hydrothermarchaeota archaeon]
RKYREKTISEVNKAVNERSIIPAIEREYSLYEIAVITRAGQAKALGISKEKGHLGAGAHADVAVYDIDASQPNCNYEEIEKKFSSAAYTIKDGEIVVKNGEIVRAVDGRTYWVSPQIDEELEKEVMKDIEYNFKRYYSVNLANYPVGEEYLTMPTKVVTNAR